jgi:hypothetical protein
MKVLSLFAKSITLIFSQKMKKLSSIFLFIISCVFLKAQTLNISEEIYIGNSEGYGFIGKYNDKVLFFNLDDNKVKLKAFDAKLHKTWEKDVEPDRKNSAKVLEVLGGKQDFNIIYQFRRKGHNYIKVHKYDGQVKLLDSTIIRDWGREMVSPVFQTIYSEDKKVVMIYEVNNSTNINALALSLDSLKPIWYRSFEFRDWDTDTHAKHVLINNNAEAYFIKDEDNRNGNIEKHRFIMRYLSPTDDKLFEVPMSNYYNLDTRFKYDNINQRLTAAGVFSVKGFMRAQGYYILNLNSLGNMNASKSKLPIDSYKFYFQPFDDEFVMALQGKKVVDNKGLADLKIQEIVHRRDGGILAIIEQVREVERQTASTSGRMMFRGDGIRFSIDYYYDNIFAISIGLDGTTHWKSIFYKKQASQDDDARFCSYFLVKTPSALRFLFNDEIERSTTVSEYLLTGTGQAERHAIMNTEGQDVNLRFRDAMQISANEVIVPSDDRRRVKLVKIQY